MSDRNENEGFVLSVPWLYVINEHTEPHLSLWKMKVVAYPPGLLLSHVRR